MLAKLGLFEQPASYTSLAFLHPTTLTEKLPEKQATVPVSFVISNTGGVPHDYQWSVSLVQGQQTRHVAAGSAQVASGKGATITSAARISCTQGKVQILVSLARPAEHIDALTACR